jgi:hypothetical protein
MCVVLNCKNLFLIQFIANERKLKFLSHLLSARAREREQSGDSAEFYQQISAATEINIYFFYTQNKNQFSKQEISLSAG